MSNKAIEVNGISKSYQLSHRNKPGYGTFKDAFANTLKRPFNKNAENSSETFWALKDVSFSVDKGEIFGIMGRNGSGKSTLLKILSRVVDPTKGQAILRGRVASLLEVGTGFHPELTGRENIFFNGSMLGMGRQEIKRKFDEIVEFAEIEKFLDTPVKFYSSGMYVRLAFSVAAHLEPEILILDEVLAVGDAGFQEKSRRKILSTMEKGSTVLFVSHSIGAVQQICTKGVLLNNGKVDFVGNTDELTSRYLEFARSEAPPEDIKDTWENDGTVVNDYFIPQELYITDENGKKVTKETPNDTDKWINIVGEVINDSDILTIGFALYSSTKSLVFMSYPTDRPKDKWHKTVKGKIHLQGKLPSHLLNAGKYKVSIVGGLHNKKWLFEPGTNIPSVELLINGGLSESPFWLNPREGLLAPVIDWRVKL